MGRLRAHACCAFVLWLVAAPSLFAVDESEIKIAERWGVVGVIAGDGNRGAETGIAVLRNNSTKRTYTLSIGDALPTEFGYVLQSVKDRSVVVAKGASRVTLQFAEAAVEDTAAAEAPTRTSRFLESYYRGLGESPVESLEPDSSEAPRTGGGTYLPLSRFGGMKDEGRSRFDLRGGGSGGSGGAGGGGDRTYRLESGGDSGSFVVNYDNFNEERDDEERDAGSPPAALTPLPPLPPVTPNPTRSEESRSEPADEAIEDSAPTY